MASKFQLLNLKPPSPHFKMGTYGLKTANGTNPPKVWAHSQLRDLWTAHVFIKIGRKLNQSKLKRIQTCFFPLMGVGRGTRVLLFAVISMSSPLRRKQWVVAVYVRKAIKNLSFAFPSVPLVIEETDNNIEQHYLFVLQGGHQSTF